MKLLDEGSLRVNDSGGLRFKSDARLNVGTSMIRGLGERFRLTMYYLDWLKRQYSETWKVVARESSPEKPFISFANSGITGGDDALAAYHDYARLNVPKGTHVSFNTRGMTRIHDARISPETECLPRTKFTGLVFARG